MRVALVRSIEMGRLSPDATQGKHWFDYLNRDVGTARASSPGQCDWQRLFDRPWLLQERPSPALRYRQCAVR